MAGAAHEEGFDRALGLRDGPALVLCGAYMASCLVLSLALLRGVTVTKEGMGRRWIGAIRGWGIAYTVTLIVGLTWLRESVLFWLLASVVVTAPLAVGDWREGRA